MAVSHLAVRFLAALPSVAALSSVPIVLYQSPAAARDMEISPSGHVASNSGSGGHLPGFDLKLNDMGSCGNACCALEIEAGQSPEALHGALFEVLKSGGDLPRGTFSHVGESSDDDFRDKGSPYQFLVQGKYTTKGPVQYPSTLDLTIRKGANASSSVLRAFTLSDLAGSLDDAGGQRYLVLANLLEALGLNATAHAQILHGCGKKSRVSAGHTAVLPEAAPLASRPNTSTCGLDGGCGGGQGKFSDLGSCGNACCTLEVAVKATPAEVYGSLKGFLVGGGDNASYAYIPGEMKNGEHPIDNIEVFGEPWKHIVQGRHITGGKRYLDILNFNIRALEGSSALLRLFSVSDVRGALGDMGQNYRSLAFLLASMGIDPSSAEVLHGCGKAI